MKRVVLVYTVLMVLTTLLPNQGAHALDSHLLNNQTTTIISDDFETDPLARVRGRWDKYISEAGNCTPGPLEIVDIPFGRKALNLSAEPFFNRTSFLLGKAFEFREIPTCARIGFSVTLKIVRTGHKVDAIAGPANFTNLFSEFMKNGISNAWPFCVTFYDGSIEFQNASILYKTETWYQIEVIFDRHWRQWELEVVSLERAREDSYRRNGSFSENLDLDACFSVSTNHFIVGFDGIEPCVLLDSLQLFYVLPDFGVTPSASEIVIKAGQSSTLNVTVESSEIPDSQFSLSLLGLVPDLISFDYPITINTDSVSTVSIFTSSSTPPGTYPITLLAIYKIPETQGNITRSCVLTLVVTSSPIPPWNQLWFWLTSIALAISIVSSTLFIRLTRKNKTVAAKMQVDEKDKQGFLICKNPKCGFREVPIDSQYCPICGKSVEER